MSHRLYFQFFVRGKRTSQDKWEDQWLVTLLEDDLRNPVGGVRSFTSPDRMREFAAHGGAEIDDAAIRSGRGSVWLTLTDEQYEKVR